MNLVITNYHPVCRRPAVVGAGRGRGRHPPRLPQPYRGRWRPRRRSARLAPGRRQTGCPRATRYGAAFALRTLSIPEPERPRRRQEAEPATELALVLRRGVAAAPLPRPARPAAGTTKNKWPRCSSVRFGGPGLSAIRASRWALAWSPPSDSGSGDQAPDRRRVRPVSGRLEGARKVVTERATAGGFDVDRCERFGVKE